MRPLPETVPLFPLPNVVLFPGTLLPLHVFEPRYRLLMRDTLAGPHRLIGIVLLRGEWERDYEACPEIYPVGCAGEIVAADLLPDGRYNAVLRGVREFEVQGEDRQRAYRVAQVAWRAPVGGSLPRASATRLRALLHRYADEHLPESMRRTFDSGSTPDDYLVNLAASAVRVSPVERQALLEAASVEERAERLCALLQLHIRGEPASTVLH